MEETNEKCKPNVTFGWKSITVKQASLDEDSCQLTPMSFQPGSSSLSAIGSMHAPDSVWRPDEIQPHNKPQQQYLPGSHEQTQYKLIKSDVYHGSTLYVK